MLAKLRDVSRAFCHHLNTEKVSIADQSLLRSVLYQTTANAKGSKKSRSQGLWLLRLLLFDRLIIIYSLRTGSQSKSRVQTTMQTKQKLSKKIMRSRWASCSRAGVGHITKESKPSFTCFGDGGGGCFEICCQPVLKDI